ncbi:unnamed protein product [Prunus brigantina]
MPRVREEPLKFFIAQNSTCSNVARLTSATTMNFELYYSNANLADAVAVAVADDQECKWTVVDGWEG